MNLFRAVTVDVKGSHAHIREHKNMLFVAGPMCRYGEDLAPMLAVLAGPDAQYLTFKKPVMMLKKLLNLEGFKTHFWSDLD